MKKIISLVLLCALCLATVLSVSSCSLLGIHRLKGTYENEGVMGLGASSLTFKLNGEVTYTIAGTSFVGTYEIEKDDGKLEIELDFESDAAEFIDGDYEFVEGKENGVKYIELDGVRFTKAD